MQSIERNHNIDRIKGICLILIIFGHCNWNDVQIKHYLFYFWVYMAVPILMIVSGYVYTLSYHRHGIKQIGEAYGKNNIIPRIIRYSAPFLICFIIESISFTVIEGGVRSPADYIWEFIRGGTEQVGIIIL